MTRAERIERAMLGDWGRVIRDPLDLLRATFLASAIAAALLGDLEDAVRLGGTFLIVLVARHLALPRPFDLALIVGMALQAFGNSLGIFTSFGAYDLVVHFVNSLAVAPTLYLLLVRLEVVPDLADARGRRQLGIFLITFMLGMSVGAIYEIYEWVADHWLGGNLKVGYTDTISDLVDDGLAALAAGAFLMLWAQRGWTTTRRLPARRPAGRRRGVVHPRRAHSIRNAPAASAARPSSTRSEIVSV